MNTYYVSDEEFKKSEMFNNFLEENPGRGNLRIRAYAASQAIPMSGLNIEIYKNIMGNKVVFFDGVTDESGVIERISLPTPRLNTDNLIAPNTINYTINVSSDSQSIDTSYSVNMYEGVCVVQNINIVPNSLVGDL